MAGVVNLIDNLSQGKSQKTVVQAFKDGELKTGDYVNYQNPVGSQYTSPAERNGVADQNFTVDLTTQWRILGLSEDGNHLLLTTAEPIQRKDVANPNTGNSFDESFIDYMSEDNGYYLYGAEGAYYATDNKEGDGELDRICSIYANDLAEEARSMTIEDINNLLGLTVKYDNPNAGVYKKNDTSYTKNFDVVGLLGQTYTYKEGDQTPSSFLGKEQINVGDIEKETAYGYGLVNDAGLNEEIGITQLIYDLLFDGTGEERYWLASYGVGEYNDELIAGPGGINPYTCASGCWADMFISNNVENGGSLGVRPVISLKPDVTVDELDKLEYRVVQSEKYKSVFGLQKIDTGEMENINERVIVECENGPKYDGDASELQYNNKYSISLGYLSSSSYRGNATIIIYKDGIPYSWYGEVTAGPM